MTETASKPTAVTRFLNFIERVGNKLPDPAIIFLFALLIIWLFSWMLSGVDFSAIDPRTGEAIIINNLLTGDALANFLTTMVKTFTGFAPLGVVLVAMLGLGVAEQSGLLSVSLASLVRRASGRTLVITVAFAGVLSSLTVDAGYVVLIPLAGLVFQLAGRSPIATRVSATCAVSGVFPLPPAASAPILMTGRLNRRRASGREAYHRRRRHAASS